MSGDQPKFEIDIADVAGIYLDTSSKALTFVQADIELTKELSSAFD
jgi:hypothetical protein